MSVLAGRAATATLVVGVLIASCGSAGHLRADVGQEPSRPNETPASHKTLRSYTVAAIGDSLTDPRSGGGKYLDHLRSRCPKSRFDAYGKGGDMVNQMRSRFAKDVFGEGAPPDAAPKPPYSHVIVFGGVNDL